MAKEGCSPIGQGRDDCEFCHGVGLVGSDGTACACVRMGGTKKKSEQTRDGAMRLAMVARGQKGEPIVFYMLGGLEAVQLAAARQYIERRWEEFKHACANAGCNPILPAFAICLRAAGFRVDDVADTMVLE